jgi:hypothetical protein
MVTLLERRCRAAAVALARSSSSIASSMQLEPWQLFHGTKTLILGFFQDRPWGRPPGRPDRAQRAGKKNESKV